MEGRGHPKAHLPEEAAAWEGPQKPDLLADHGTPIK